MEYSDGNRLMKNDFKIASCDRFKRQEEATAENVPAEEAMGKMSFDQPVNIIHNAVRDPHGEVCALELCGHEGKELEGGTEAGALLAQKFNLHVK